MDSEIMETAAATPRRHEGGFTLVELLIVIVILGVLSTVAVFAVRGITDKGDTAACQADYKTLETGIEAYLAQTPSVTDVTDQQVLIDADFLRAPGSSKYVIVDATDIDTVEGGSCTYDPDEGVRE